MTGLLAFTILFLVAVCIWAVRARNKETSAAMLAAAAAIAVAIIGNALTNIAAADREIVEAHRLHKVQVYTEFADLVVDLFSGVRALDVSGSTEDEKHRNQDQLTLSLGPKFFDFSKKLLLWGSPEVIQAYGRFRSFGQNGQANSQAEGVEILLAVDDVFRAMRRDLELPNEGLQRGTLMKLFLSDPQSLDAMMRR